ncbi:DUF6861 domain-containing protein [Pseudomonas syringae]|uniref:DUF6861 domain-containing protein n=1 Tax=Pseudomonas syringae TaxID=317 RepID=UPI001F2C1C6D|nr:hypothetical protein [Pseudomonas syringae]GKQ45751.1 hypothetical protein PSTH2693_11365 [Pseudomonas syringae pv. theae]
MLLWTIVPSWYEIEQRIVRGMGQQVGSHFRTHRNEPVPSISLTIRRFTCVRVAFIRAEWEACRILTQRFSDLDISSIVKELIDAVSQMAMIIAGSALAGGLTGAGAGLLLGGVSAVPMGAMGAALGVQASMFILSMLGLKRVAESFEEGLPRILDYYQRGIKTAWEGPRGESGLNPFMGDDPLAQNSAVQSIAQGHVEVVILLLGAIAHYLTRGRGDARILAQDMQVSAKGARLGQWMLKHEDALKRRPDLQRPEPRKGAFDTRETNNPSTAAPKALRRPQADPVKPPTVSPKLVSPTYRELQGLNKGLQAHHILPQYLGKMLGYTKNDMLDHPATLITQHSHTGKANPEAMHKAISKYLPPLAGGKKQITPRNK